MLAILTSRTLIRTCLVASLLLFALNSRLTMAVRTAYESGWQAKPDECRYCRLASTDAIAVHSAAAFFAVALLLVALAVWWIRRRRELVASVQPAELASIDAACSPLLPVLVALAALALLAAGAAAGLTAGADSGRRGFVALTTGLELAALALIAATALGVARTTSPGSLGTGAVVSWGRWFLQRLRITLIAVGLMAFVLTMFGQTSPQAIDSMRVWSEFDGDRSLARLSFGLATTLLLALVIYEGGMRLTRPGLGSGPRRRFPAWWSLGIGVGVALAWIPLYFLLHRSLGWGLLVCAGILIALALLELGHASGRDPAPPPVFGFHKGAVELLAVVPLLTLALVALAAAVDTGLAQGGAWEALRVFAPGAVLAAFAVVLTSDDDQQPVERTPLAIWLVGGSLFALSIGLLIWFHLEEWPATSAVGFVLFALAALYAISVFRGHGIPVLDRLGRWRLAVAVALASGLTTFFILHLDPEGFGQTLGAFALLNLSLAFVLAWLPRVIEWSIERRPPRIMWALGLQQLPLVSLVGLAWILAGIVKPPPTLHDVRLVDHAGSAGRPTLTQVFEQWRDAQPELAAGTPGPPVPLVLVAAHGGGIKAAYWTALVLDCVVAVSPAGFDASQAQEGDERTCTDRRRDAAAQQRAARRVFLTSSVSGGAMGVFAYARQLLASDSLDPGWFDRRLARDFVSPTVGWALFHDIPNHILGLHPRERGVCAWHFFNPCATMDRSTVLEGSFDDAFDDVPGGEPALRETWEARQSNDPQLRARASAVPLLVNNSTVTGGKARAVLSAADLGVWPNLDGAPPSAADPRPLAGTVEVADALCMSNDLRLSTASLLAGRFPYVAASGRFGPLCGARDGRVEERDRASNCARIRVPAVCTLNLVDGGYAENSGLFTIVGLWPALNRLVRDHNLASERQIALVIVEIDNHYRPRARDVPRGSGGTHETLIPPATAFGARQSLETYARAAAHRITGKGCTLTISPRLHPGLVVPLGWELSAVARDDLRRGLVEPRPNTTGKQRLTPVLDLRRIQSWLGGEIVPGLGSDLESCVPG